MQKNLTSQTLKGFDIRLNPGVLSPLVCNPPKPQTDNEHQNQQRPQVELQPVPLAFRSRGFRRWLHVGFGHKQSSN
jgi:hypothetical protein